MQILSSAWEQGLLGSLFVACTSDQSLTSLWSKVRDRCYVKGRSLADHLPVQGAAFRCLWKLLKWRRRRRRKPILFLTWLGVTLHFGPFNQSSCRISDTRTEKPATQSYWFSIKYSAQAVDKHYLNCFQVFAQRWKTSVFCMALRLMLMLPTLLGMQTEGCAHSCQSSILRKFLSH